MAGWREGSGTVIELLKTLVPQKISIELVELNLASRGIKIYPYIIEFMAL